MKIENLDLRGVEEPKPLLTVLHKISNLPKGTTLEAILDNYPYQLYDLLQQRGWSADFTKRPDGAFRLQAILKSSEARPH
ncbi:MAG: DUF2249 domain-containing protein [Verrucomicrobiales bacterium]